MKNKTSFLFMLFFFAIMGCEKPGENAPVSIKGVLLESADYIGIVKSDKKKSNSQNWTSLYSFTKENGQLIKKELKFIDENNEVIDPKYIFFECLGIIPISEKYLILDGEMTVTFKTHVKRYFPLLDMEDGSIYDFGSHIPYDNSYDQSNKKIQSDAASNLYYNYDGTIYKLSTNQNGITREEYVHKSQAGNGIFFIAPNGDCFMDKNEGTKIKNHSGGIISLDKKYYGFFNMNEKVFAFAENELFEFIVNDDVCNIILQNNQNFTMVNNPYHRIESENYTYILKSSRGGSVSINETLGFLFYNDSQKIYDIKVPLEFTENEMKIDYFDQYYIYVSSDKTQNKEIYRFDLTDFDIVVLDEPNSKEIVLPKNFIKYTFPEEYEIFSYSFIESGEIQFDGFNLNDETTVSGIVDLNNMIDITETVGYKIEFLTKLN